MHPLLYNYRQHHVLCIWWWNSCFSKPPSWRHHRSIITIRWSDFLPASTVLFNPLSKLIPTTNYRQPNVSEVGVYEYSDSVPFMETNYEQPYSTDYSYAQVILEWKHNIIVMVPYATVNICKYICNSTCEKGSLGVENRCWVRRTKT